MLTTKLSPQSQLVYDHLVRVGSITNVEAHAVHRVRSLSRRITEISDAGAPIKKDRRRDVTGQFYVRYSLGKK
ncbi:hypothetical protein RSP795_10320 [Ralstonia solanacearum]|uniref:helix-turn-helix domain-containing protein n=1 Tax=Ralstonia solanacearum TaxID=305 RepID=UPI0007D74E0D|nr:helix-turn-helix domain-containing protein [Ralstonia solanacearum]OAI62822.1 hypothetical protein RSP795_10320 [Ralstonia solanacearum]